MDPWELGLQGTGPFQVEPVLALPAIVTREGSGKRRSRSSPSRRMFGSRSASSLKTGNAISSTGAVDTVPIMGGAAEARIRESLGFPYNPS